MKKTINFFRSQTTEIQGEFVPLYWVEQKVRDCLQKNSFLGIKGEGA